MFDDYEDGVVQTKIFKNFLRYFVLINVLFFLYFKLLSSKHHRKNFPFNPKIEMLTINNGSSLKIGIISDFQLDITKPDPVECAQENLEQTLKVLKKKKVNLILIAGDITNDGKISSYRIFIKTVEKIFGKNTPKIISIMGNHDYSDFFGIQEMEQQYLSKSFFENKKQQQRIFYFLMNQYPFSHYLINDFHFIFLSQDNYMVYEKGLGNVTDWLESQLKIAHSSKKNSGDPIFVISHIQPYNTVYGSDFIWGSKKLFDVLKKYEEVISISGHSHYSLNHKRSIWQGNFTAINTQSISYVDLNYNFTNYKNVVNKSKNNSYMGLIANLTKNKIIFERIFFESEIKVPEKWQIDFPISSENFKYKYENNSNVTSDVSPYFTDITEMKFDKNKKTIIFHLPIHEYEAYCYEIILENKDNGKKENLKYYSEYYLNPKYRKYEEECIIPNNISSGKYNVEIYIIDMLGVKINKPLKGNIEF